MKEQVAAVLDKVRPVLQRDGGDVELVEVSDDGVVLVRLKGACSGCPGATMTLKAVIENLLVKEVPGVTRVVGVYYPKRAEQLNLLSSFILFKICD